MKRVVAIGAVVLVASALVALGACARHAGPTTGAGSASERAAGVPEVRILSAVALPRTAVALSERSATLGDSNTRARAGTHYVDVDLLLPVYSLAETSTVHLGSPTLLADGAAIPVSDTAYVRKPVTSSDVQVTEEFEVPDSSRDLSIRLPFGSSDENAVVLPVQVGK